MVTNTADGSVTVFTAQDLRESAPPAAKAQADPREIKETDFAARTNPDNAGTNFLSNPPLIFGTVAAAMLIGPHAWSWRTCGGASGPEGAGDAATSGPPLSAP